MSGSKSRNHSRRTYSGTARRYEHTSARTAVLRALDRQTDSELRSAVRGTWIELELDLDRTDDSAEFVR